jgi:hypothetical protein
LSDKDGSQFSEAIDRHYRAFVGPSTTYDIIGASQFNLLTSLGLREHHKLLDIGCGSLRGGRLFIPYLQPGGYSGIEPEQWLVEEGIENEIGHDQITLKSPRFDYNAEFNLRVFGEQFDFLLAQSIFSHTSASQLKHCLSEAAQVMKPTSIFAATYFPGDEDYTGVEWVYPGRVYYTPEFMQKTAADYDLSMTNLNWLHPNGQTWVVFVRRGHENIIPPINTSGIDISSYTQKISEYERILNILHNRPEAKLRRAVRRLLGWNKKI